jgi:hypothetical protein
MQRATYTGLAAVIVLVLAGRLQVIGQAPGVPICARNGTDPSNRSNLLIVARGLFAEGGVLKVAEARRQLKRASCQLTLPEPGTKKMTAREVCVVARRSHLRVGWACLCDKCGRWHLNVAGGYALTTNGAVATCFHVVEPGRTVREGCLVAIDEEGAVLPVTEVLAGNRESDACIVRVGGKGFRPLPLNTHVYPGDAAYCYSDPADHRDYFSAGIVNRFYHLATSGSAGARTFFAAEPTRINVSTDWAPGSSGSAVLDECGNAIGHVAMISSPRETPSSKTEDTHVAKPAPIVFHEAVSARDVLSLIRR